MIKYFKKIIDDNGYTHSIDNVVCQYLISMNYKKATEKIEEIANDFKLGNKYYTILDRVPSVKYDFFVNHIHLDFIYIKLGCYKEKLLDENGGKSSYEVLDYMSVEVNPNKHSDSDLFNKFFDFVKSVECGSSWIKRVDYAVDVPVKISDVIPCNSRKEKGLYKGTVYFGQRQKNGFVRIYDKSKESELDTPLTRIETVVKFGKKDKFSSIDFGVVSLDSSQTDEKLTPTVSVLVSALRDLMLAGNDVSDYLSKLDRRTRQKIEPLLYGNLKHYKSSSDLLNKLLDDVKELFYVNCNNLMPDVYEDEEGFLHFDGDFDDIPF